MLKGKSVLDDTTAMGPIIESAVFKHLFARYYQRQVRFTYWRGKKDSEVDLVAEMADELVPFEVKYRGGNTGPKELRGMIELCVQKKLTRGYVITRSLSDYGLLEGLPYECATKIFRIPAPLLCYWMGESETHSASE
jgi:predicted AAA+ superfamily ATPase